MTIFEFDLLTEEKQIELLYRNASYIGKRQHKKQVVALYQLEAFYVEIWYKKYRYYINSIRSTQCLDVLDCYSVEVDVTEILKCVD